MSTNRRDFLKAGATVAAVALAGPRLLHASPFLAEPTLLVASDLASMKLTGPATH